MDYMNQGLAFKIKKALRYVALHGIGRTRIKILSQMHLRKRFPAYPERAVPRTSRHTVALVGCGNYSFSTLAYYLVKNYGHVIAACMDRDLDKAYSLAGHYKVPKCTADFQDILDDKGITLVYIASNHASHAEYGIQALERGKHVYLEKPHVVSESQLERLVAAMERFPGRVFIGFNRPGNRFGRMILEHLKRESGPGMYSWHVIGHPIAPDHWYMKSEEGGRILGNLCHWTDFSLLMVPENAFPIRINPTRARHPDFDIAVSYTFGDGTIASICFSAKGHTFEGVRERFSAHKGNAIIYMDDYERMTVEVGESKRTYRNRFRDYGHQAMIKRAYEAVRDGEPFDRKALIAYIWNTGWLFLKTKEAFEKNESIVIHSFEEMRRGREETALVLTGRP